MKINCFLFSIIFLIGCSNNSAVYQNVTSPLFDDSVEILVDDSANKEGPQNSIKLINQHFTHLGLDSSRSGGNLSLSQNLDILWKKNVGKVKSNLMTVVSNLVANDNIVFVMNY